jgi:hypothetical protein
LAKNPERFDGWMDQRSKTPSGIMENLPNLVKEMKRVSNWTYLIVMENCPTGNALIPSHFPFAKLPVNTTHAFELKKNIGFCVCFYSK